MADMNKEKNALERFVGGVQQHDLLLPVGIVGIVGLMIVPLPTLLLDLLLAVPYLEVSRYRAVLENSMPFSTKHGVKGDEFQNVIVVLDDAGANWNQYSFGKLLAGTDTSESRERRTRHLFYVCCSRAKDKLIVAVLGVGAQAKIEALFGASAVAM